jgi:bifunctional enzyme CysN/CysC
VNGPLESHDDVVTYLQRHEQKEILRFVAVGSVDDGKSTLIGRLLHDTDGVYDDQLKAVRRASNMEGAEIDFSLFTDGLKAEREQGITIDVAYRYFTTAARKFIIADTPGHVQYTRNMATGASTASVAIILIDARLGVLQQSRRHAYIASLLGIPHLVVGVNKMDLRGWDPAAYEAIRREFTAFAARLDFKDVTFIPMSALRGDNVVHRSTNMPFYGGQTLLEYLETVPVAADRNLDDFRYPVQLVLRPNLDYRGYAAQIASGVVKKGDAVMVLPSRKTSRVAAIDTYGGEVDVAFAPMSVTLRLADEIDVSRGDMLVHPTNAPRVAQRFDAMMVWLHERPLDPEKAYLLKHTTQTVRAQIERVDFAVDLETLEHVPAKDARLGLNEIGRVSVRAHRPLFVDAYRANRSTGAFVLIDSLTNDTVAAGMIEAAGDAREGAPSGHDAGEGARTQVSPSERRERLGHGAAAVVLEGLAPAALLRVAFAAERLLFDRGALAAVVVDPRAVGPLVRAGLLVIHVAAARVAEDLDLDAAHVVRPVFAADDASDEAAGARAVVRALDAARIFER